MTTATAFVDALASAITAGSRYPAFPEGLSIAEAEQLQRALVARVAPAGTAGLKVGLGDRPVQEALGLDGPLLGWLYAGRGLDPGADLVADPAVRIECELGVRIAAGGAPIALCPVVELVRPEFAQPSEVTGPNLVACNIAADRFLAGPPRPWDPGIEGEVTVERDGEQVLRASMTASLGGPEKALGWIIAECTRREIQLDDGALLITGTCGSALPLVAGSYVVTFDGLGSLELTAR